MTLATDIYVTSPTAPGPVLAELVRLVVSRSEGVHIARVDAPVPGYVPGTMLQETECGQGLAAWVRAAWSPDSPVAATYPDWDYGTGGPPPVHSVRLTLDTGYAYRGPDGEGAGALHTWCVAGLGQWLEGVAGLSWSWRNEYTGEVHQGYDGLHELAGSDEASRALLARVLGVLGGEDA